MSKMRGSFPKDEGSTAKALKKEFMTISAKDIHAYYRHCSLTYGQDPLKDLEGV